jgi:hypothetical protein
MFYKVHSSSENISGDKQSFYNMYIQVTMQENQNKYPLPNSKLLILYALIEYAYFVANRAQIFKASNDKGYATTFTSIRK